MLVEYGGSALVVTHDRWFLDRVATSLLVFEGDGRVVRYAGNHQDYLLQRAAAEAARQEEAARQAARQQEEAARAAAKEKPAARPAAKKLTWAERKELEGIMDRIEEAEGAVAELERALADPGLYASRGDEVSGLLARLSEAKERATALTARWEELERKQAEAES
jgi:ATP-binding cassette subfamily F protein uup